MAFDETNLLETAAQANNGDFRFFDRAGAEGIVAAANNNGEWCEENGSTVSVGTGPTSNPTGRAGFVYTETSGPVASIVWEMLWDTAYDNNLQNVFLDLIYNLNGELTADIFIEYATIASPNRTTDWTTLETINSTFTDAWISDTFDFSAVAKTTTLWVRVRLDTDSNFTNDFAFSTFRIYGIDSEGITSVDSDYGVGADEFDFDDTSLEVNGLNFQATQTTGTIYASPNTLLSLPDEVDISAGVIAWNDTGITVDCSLLSDATIDALHALMDTDPTGAMNIIVLTSASDEYFLPVTMHRPAAWEMVATAAFTPANLGERLTMAGTFGGGRGEETAAQNPSTTLTDIGLDQDREDLGVIQAKLNARAVAHGFILIWPGDLLPDTITETPVITVTEASLAANPSLAFTLSPDLKATGELDNAIQLQLSVIADLTAAGKLDAAAAMVFAMAADLKAAGQLDAAVNLIFSVSADLKAASLENIEALVQMAFTAIADLNAQGELDVAAALAFAVAADLRTIGELDSAIAMEFSAVADLQAAGKLDAAAALAFTVAGDLRATGQLDAAAALVFSIAADLRSTGQLDAAPALAFTTVADLQATGKLDAAADLVFALSADLQAIGENTIQANVAMAFTAIADLKARGELDAAAALAFAVSADLRTRGELGASVAMMFSTVASLTAAGKLDATAAIIFSGAADLTAAGKLDAAAALAFTLSPDMSSTVSMNAVVNMAISLIGDLKATGQLAATPTLLMSINADLQTIGSISAAPAMAFSLSPDLSSRGSIDAAPAMNLSLSPDLTAGGSLAAAPSLAFSMAPALTSRGALLASVLMQFSIIGNIVDGSADTFPNSEQELIANLLNSFQDLVAGPNSSQILA